MRALILAFFVLMLIIKTGNASSLESRDEREVKMAQSAIFWYLIASGSEASIKSCASNWLACGDDRAELGLALLGGKKTNRGAIGLSSAIRYSMDGGLSEDYTCYILKRGKSIIPFLYKLNAQFLHEECQSEFRDAKKYNSTLFFGVRIDHVCMPSNKINIKKEDLIRKIGEGVQCDDGDF